MALGVEAAGLVAAVGDQVAGITTGDRVTVHSAPLREQGTWAEQHIAAAGHVAVPPPGVPFEAAAALPVPALTADQVIGDALQIRLGSLVQLLAQGLLAVSVDDMFPLERAGDALARQARCPRLSHRAHNARLGRD